MKTALPEAFVRRMREQLGNELSAFLHVLDDVPVRGIRFNPLKKTEAADSLKTGEQIPWEQSGYYLDTDSCAGSMILHEAGAFYIQEPGAMMPAAVLEAKPGEKVLDLCAAPGGKTSQLAQLTGGKAFITFIFDSGFNLVITLTVVNLIIRLTDLPILPVYAIA